MIIEGKLHVKMDTVNVTNTFVKREFVVEVADNPLYPQLVKFETTQDRTSILDGFKVGDIIEVTFNLKGREWVSPQNETKYFNTLDAWRIQKPINPHEPPRADEAAAKNLTPEDFGSDSDDDLPF